VSKKLIALSQANVIFHLIGICITKTFLNVKIGRTYVWCILSQICKSKSEQHTNKTFKITDDVLLNVLSENHKAIHPNYKHDIGFLKYLVDKGEFLLKRYNKKLEKIFFNAMSYGNFEYFVDQLLNLMPFFKFKNIRKTFIEAYENFYENWLNISLTNSCSFIFVFVLPHINMRTKDREYIYICFGITKNGNFKLLSVKKHYSYLTSHWLFTFKELKTRGLGAPLRVLALDDLAVADVLRNIYPDYKVDESKPPKKALKLLKLLKHMTENFRLDCIDNGVRDFVYLDTTVTYTGMEVDFIPWIPTFSPD
jgi:hypothetical protein